MYEKLLELCQSKNISITNLCLNITGSRGNLSTWKKGNINPISLVKIADYFNVSVDYLLGRTKEPQRIQINSSNVVNGDNGNNSPLTLKNNQDEMSIELLKKFNELSFDEKIEVFNYIKSRKA